MAIKNMENLLTAPANYHDPTEITPDQLRAYPNYTRSELLHVKQAMSDPKRLKKKMEQLLEELKLIRDFQLAVPRDKHYREDDIDQEFDQAIDGVECVIQVVQNFEEELMAGHRISKTFDSRFYARR